MSAPDSDEPALVPMPTSRAARMLGEGPVRLVPLPDAEPPEAVTALAGEYIGVALAGGVALGLVAGLLLPARAGRKLAAAGGLAAKLSEGVVARAREANAGKPARAGDLLVDVLVKALRRNLRKG